MDVPYLVVAVLGGPMCMMRCGLSLGNAFASLASLTGTLPLCTACSGSAEHTIPSPSTQTLSIASPSSSANLPPLESSSSLSFPFVSIAVMDSSVSAPFVLVVSRFSDLLVLVLVLVLVLLVISLVVLRFLSKS